MDDTHVDDPVRPAALTPEHDRVAMLREQDLLWSVVDLVRRCPGRPPRARLDDVLAGRPRGPGPLVTLPPRSARVHVGP